MKSVAGIAFFVLLLQACGPLPQQKAPSGIHVSSNILTVQKVTLLNDDAKELKVHAVKFGESVHIMLDGMKNYTEKDGLVYPVSALEVRDQEGHKMLEQNVNALEGVAAQDANVLLTSFKTGNPMQIGQIYHLKLSVFDRYNTASIIVAEADLQIK